MKYENARDLLPEPLLRQVQKYISGQLVYIPSRERKREWGAASGYREYLRQRNQDIRAQFALGLSVDQLADEYHLSCESIKRIVYNKKEMIPMQHKGTLTSAKEWAAAGQRVLDVRSAFLAVNMTPSQRAYARELAIERRAR